MRIFVISDTHFGHDNMYKFVTFDGVTRVRKEFSSAAEADRAMVERWNAVVRPEDHVWHLGDVTMQRTKEQLPGIVELITSLFGHKRLILGNHDYFDFADYKAMGFQKIKAYEWKGEFILSHVPLHPEGLWNKINVHGHIHERQAYNEKYRNVSVEQINYTPILLDSLRSGVI